MYIQEKMLNLNTLTVNEKIVSEYILSHTDDLLNLSINTIAKSTFTSAPTIVRLSNKLGYTGWTGLKHALYEEIQYLQANFEEVDPNLPFQSTDNIIEISNKIASLLSETVYDTASLIDQKELQNAVDHLTKSNIIYIFAITNTASATYDFECKMRFLSHNIRIIQNPEEFKFFLLMANANDCCMFISCSGETFNQYDIIPQIKLINCPTISITGIGDNSLKKITDIHLHISSKENLFTSIANYVSNQSIHYILDVLYSCVFNKNFNNNILKKKSISNQVDKNRSKSSLK